MIKIGEDEFSLLYEDGTFSVNLKFLALITSNVAIKQKMVTADLDFLRLKDANVELSKGKFQADITQQSFALDAEANSFEVGGKLALKYADGVASFALNNASASSIEHFMSNIASLTHLNPSVSEWIYPKVLAKNYFIHEFSGEFDTQKMRLQNMRGRADLSGVSVKFHENLPPLFASNSNLTFDGANFYFDFDKPTYEGLNLAGSKVEILDTFANSSVKVFLQNREALDARVKRVLSEYGVALPLSQKGGQLQSSVLLDIGLKPFKFKPSGEFVLKGGQIALASAWFETKGAYATLKDNKIFVKNASLKDDIFTLTGEGVIDLASKTGEFSTQIKRFCLAGCTLANLTAHPQNISLDFTEDVSLKLNEFDLNLVFANKTTIYTNNISTLTPFSPLAKAVGLKGGGLSVQTKNFKTFDILIRQAAIDSPLQNYKQDDFQARVAKQIFVTSKSKKFALDFDEANSQINIRLKNTMLDLYKSIKLAEDLGKIFTTPKVASEAGEAEANSLLVTLKGKNLTLQAFNTSANFASLNAYYTNNSLWANSKFSSGGKLWLKNKEENFLIKAQGVSGELINSLVKTQVVKGGRFGVEFAGDFNNFQAQLTAANSTLKGIAFYKNFISFLDTIPSILTLKIPDFSPTGMFVKHGVANVEKKGEELKILGVKLNGENIDVSGILDYNLKNDAINGSMEIAFLKNTASVIAKIPVVNQIILGENRQFFTLLDVGGTLAKTKFQTHITTDLLKLPYNLVRNLVLVPFSFGGGKTNELSKPNLNSTLAK